MTKKIYVGNINYSTTEDDLRDLFSQYGGVDSVKIIIDKFTERSKGFGFVEMQEDDSATAAISALNNSEFQGRNIKVNEAINKPDRRPRNNY